METVSEQKKSSSLRRSRIIGLIALPFLCVGAYQMGLAVSHEKAPEPEPLERPPIHIDPASLDFGEVLETKRFPLKLELRNATDQPIDILRFETSCNCASVQPPTLHIPAGGSASMEVVLDLALRLTSGPSPDLRPHQAMTTAVLAQGKQSWIVKGRVRRLLELSANTINFGDVLLKGAAAEPRIIAVRPRVPIGEIKVESPSRFIRATLTNHFDSYRLAIEPNTQQAGSFQSEVILHLTDAKGDPLPHQTIPVAGVVTEPVIAVPGIVEFGVRKVGDDAEETILLRSRTRMPFRIIGMYSDSSEINFKSLPSAPSNGVAVVVRKTFKKLGKQKDRVAFDVEYGADERLNVSLDVAYYGVGEKN